MQATTKLSKSDSLRFGQLKQIVDSGIAICALVGSALKEIKDKKYYLSDGFTNFADFCKAEWGWARRYCDQLIMDAQTIKSLPAPMQELLASDKAARELSKVPVALRPAVVEVAVEEAKGEPVTGAGIKAAAKKVIPPRPPEEPSSKASGSAKPPPRAKTPPPKRQPEPDPDEGAPRDDDGHVVPIECRQAWLDAVEVGKSYRSKLSELKGYLKGAQDRKDKDHYEVRFTDTLAHLNQAYVDLCTVLPSRLCPDCSGVDLKDNCTCGGRGWVSQFYWMNCVPEEIRLMRKGKNVKGATT